MCVLTPNPKHMGVTGFTLEFVVVVLFCYLVFLVFSLRISYLNTVCLYHFRTFSYTLAHVCVCVMCLTQVERSEDICRVFFYLLRVPAIEREVPKIMQYVQVPLLPEPASQPRILFYKHMFLSVKILHT